MPASKDPATSAGCTTSSGGTAIATMIHGGEATLTDEQIHTHVVSNTLAFAPEAKGLRTHSLYYDSTLLPLYRLAGLEYDYSYQMPFRIRFGRPCPRAARGRGRTLVPGARENSGRIGRMLARHHARPQNRTISGRSGMAARLLSVWTLHALASFRTMPCSRARKCIRRVTSAHL